MSAVAPAPPPVNPIPATNGVESTQPATTNNAGSAGEATTASAVQTPEEVGQKVFAGNLAYATTEDGLKQFFSAFTNEIISSEVIQRGPRPAGYGFVTFKTREAAEKAVAELHEKELDGRPVIVQLAKPSAEKEKERNERRNKRRATGRRNTKAPPGEVTEAEAEGQTEHSALQKAENVVEGAVAAVGEAIKPKKKKTNRKKKAKKAAAAAGEPAPGTENQGEASAAGEPGAATEATTEAAPKKAKKPKAPKPTRPPRAVGEEPEGSPSKNMLFVANLAFSIDDARLKQIFTDAGVDVVSARVVQRRWGARRSKGFGFVDVGNEEEQKKALAYFAPVEGPDGTTTGKEVEGRQIAVKVAVDAPKKEAGETDADAAGSAAQKDDSSPDAIVVAH